MAKYFRAADVLPPSVLADVLDRLIDVNPDWAGGLIYFPAQSGNTAFSSKEQLARKKAQSIVLSHDGYSATEVAAMLDISTRTVANWKKKYGAPVIAVLKKLREENQNG